MTEVFVEQPLASPGSANNQLMSRLNYQQVSPLLCEGFTSILCILFFLFLRLPTVHPDKAAELSGHIRELKQDITSPTITSPSLHHHFTITSPSRHHHFMDGEGMVN